MKNGSRLTEEERARLAAFVGGTGQRKAATALGLARNTVVKLLRGQSVCRGTATQARSGIALATKLELKP
jgi:FixJ family two-component response regulator